ncbi:MAG: cytochrome c-type biogenesis protein CcmH [Polyangiaceae bacterium]
MILARLARSPLFERLSRPRRRSTEPARTWTRRMLFVLLLVGSLPFLTAGEAVGQSHNVTGSGTVTIKNETERTLFFSLICMCGCPRETLGTCPCDYGSARRAELREMLDNGMSIEAIQKAYGDRFGTNALALPPNKGASRLIWALPLVAFIAGAILVARLLRRWAARGAAERAAQPATAGNAKRDEYDDKLDAQLRELDNE